MELKDCSVATQQLGHLGIVASMIERLGLMEKINKRLPLDKSKGGIVPHGQRVGAMILNGLGFMGGRLYMTSSFFEDKPVSHLLGDGLCASHLNDDCLGRCLDAIATYGITKLLSEVVFEVAQEQGLLNRRLHLDTTRLTLYGDYEVEEDTPGPLPKLGYSKAHRPDLKQVVLSLVEMGPANIPVWMEALDGNSSDKKSFQETVRRVTEFMQALKTAPEHVCFVVDAAFYVPEKLAELNAITWITRVPSTLTEAKRCLNLADEQIIWQQVDQNYRISAYEKMIAGQAQRWLMVHSTHAAAREWKTLCRRMDKQAEELSKTLWHLSCQRYACETDAKRALADITKKLAYHSVHAVIKPHIHYAHKGRPKPNEQPAHTDYQILATFTTDINKVRQLQQRLGRFILATNEQDTTILQDAQILAQYKEQSHSEGGFRFIKDPAFEVDSVFLKTPERIGALMMIMTLCLMVYNVAQYQLRQCLQENNDTLPNQLGKPLKNPTMRWLFQLLNTISVVCIQLPDKTEQRIVTHVNDIHRKIILYFGTPACQIYDVPSNFKFKFKNLNPKKLADWCEM
jgi:transposase